MKRIFTGGKIYTGDMPFVSAMAVEDGRFIYAGDDAGALALAGRDDEINDLQGRFVCAGFNDSHMHLLSYGLSLRRARLDQHTDSLSGLIAYFRDFARETGANERGWLVGRGWNQDLFTDETRMPDRWDLDQVSGDIPTLAVRCCGHCAVVNSRALEIMGVTRDTPAPPGGAIGMADGVPDGRFYDAAMDMIYSRIPDVDVEDVKKMILAAAKGFNACGVTSCQSDDYSTDWRMVDRAYRELIEEGLLTVRVYEQCNFHDAASLASFIAEGHVTGQGDAMFRHGPLKMVADGALGARTAYLSRPYSDDPSTRGLMLYTPEEMEEMISLAHNSGMQVAVHAIGDGCLDILLDAVEKALDASPRADHRHGVVHCQITRGDQLERMKRLGMHIYAQSIFLDYDSRIVRSRVGDMADTSYSWKTLMNFGLTVSNGTDCPVERPDALRGIQCAVTRAPLAGGEKYLPREAFTVREAIDSYTSAGAVASFEEKVKGKIAPGMLADFVILGGDPFSTPEGELARIPVMETWLGGERVWLRP